MAKITALPLDSAPSGTDYIPTVDTTDTTTKKVLLSGVRDYIGANPYNPYKFSAYLNTPQSISSGSSVFQLGSPLSLYFKSG